MKLTKAISLLLCGGAFVASSAGAVTLTASNTTATINSQHAVTVTLDRQGTTTAGFLFDLTYNNTHLTLPAHTDPAVAHPRVSVVGAGAADFGCNDLPTPGVLRCLASTTVTSATYVVTINFDVGATAVPSPGTPLALTGQYTTATFDDVNYDNHPIPSGSVIIQAASPDVVLGFAPASAVAFGGGTSGTNPPNQNIAVSVASGTIGTGTVSGCVLGGTNASAFSVVSGDPTTAPPGGNIVLQATLANTALNATLTCNVADAGAATTRVWTLTAPAGTPVPAPAYSSNPVQGTPISRTGTPGSTTACNSSVVISNTGFAGTGSDLTYSCAVTGPDFSIASGASGTVAVGSSATVSVAVACPAVGSPVADTLVCTSNDPAVSTATYPLSATGVITVAPTFVPASSLWSKLALFGIFAALGMLVLGLRRNH